jgi:hypothetical protein
MVKEKGHIIDLAGAPRGVLGSIPGWAADQQEGIKTRSTAGVWHLLWCELFLYLLYIYIFSLFGGGVGRVGEKRDGRWVIRVEVPKLQALL